MFSKFTISYPIIQYKNFTHNLPAKCLSVIRLSMACHSLSKKSDPVHIEIYDHFAGE